ncbi:MAG: M35 family metallo-endopeptidase [Paraburkholderia sp.]
MTDAEFRKRVLVLRDCAAIVVGRRLAALSQWSIAEQARVTDWFGRSDAAIYDRLMSGLPALKKVLEGLGPKNFLRASPELDRYLGCMPHLKNVQEEAAHVCAPDTRTHTMCIAPKFCTMPEVHMFNESKLATIVHEATHFVDTFGSADNMYGFNSYMKVWARSNPDLATRNADSIALYVLYGEEIHV